MMRGIAVLALASCWFSSCPAAQAGRGKPSVDEVRELVEAAAVTWDRREFAGGSVAIRASVAIRLPGRDPLDGQWSFERVGAGLFREELRLPGFHEVLVSNGEGWWLDRTDRSYLQLVADIQDALDPARHLRLGERRSITAVRTGKVGGTPVIRPRVVEMAGSPPAPFELSLDPATGAPVRFDCRLSHASYEYSGGIELEGVRMPRQVRVLHSNQVVVTIDLEQASPRAAEVVLLPPEGASPWVPESAPHCGDFKPPVATVAPELRYPGEAAFARAAGQVRGRLLIGREGEILGRHVSWASDAMFAEAALAALEGRRYRPGRCAGEPARVLSEVTFWFGRLR